MCCKGSLFLNLLHFSCALDFLSGLIQNLIKQSAVLEILRNPELWNRLPLPTLTRVADESQKTSPFIMFTYARQLR